MDWMYLVYFSLAVLIFFGAKSMGRGNWNDEFTSREQTKILHGVMALGVALHHMAQKTCGPWHERYTIVHGLDPFLSVGYVIVGVFLFCSGLGLYKSYKTRPDYLKGFVRRRILPIVIAFYLSEIVYTIVRTLMGEHMTISKVLWYLSGLRMANYNSWFVIVIPFFYFVFWLAFRFCRREGTAIFWIFLFTLGYTVIGAVINHQNTWWMRGEWWYNSILLFPLGMVFGKYEPVITKTLRKGYWFWLIFFFAGFFLLFRQSEWLIDTRLGYYDRWLWHRLASAGIQWLVALFFVMFCFTMMMKIRLGNKALAWLGAMSLDFYLMHGMFVDMFGFNFADIAKSAVYIKNVPLYMMAVLGCSIPATILFAVARKRITWLLIGRKTHWKTDTAGPAKGEESKPEKPEEVLARLREKYKEPGKTARIAKKAIWPVLCIVLLAGGYIVTRQDPVRDVGGLIFTPPEGFRVSYSSTAYTIWEYSGGDRKLSPLNLSEEVKGRQGINLSNAEEVLAECDWLEKAELYVNPNGIRMARGFSTQETDFPQRRYYVETNYGIALLLTNENSIYYDVEACEKAILEMADSIRRK